MKLLILSTLRTEFVAQCWRCRGTARLRHLRAGRDIAGSPEKASISRRAPPLAGKPIVYVPGNHEFYGGEIETAARRKEAASARTCVCSTAHRIIAGVRFVGAILWTDTRFMAATVDHGDGGARAGTTTCGSSAAVRKAPCDSRRRTPSRAIWADGPSSRMRWRRLRRPDRRRDPSRPHQARWAPAGCG